MKKEDEKEKVGIVFVADHWGECTGGIDTFNEKLCEEMAYVVDQSEISVICLVFGTINTHYIQEYKEKGIILVSYKIAPTEELEKIYIRARKEIINSVCCHRYIWIGHDLKTGNEALAISQKSKEDKCAVIFHTDYYSMHAERSDIYERRDRGDDYEKLSEKQKNLAAKVDWCFLVGPILRDRFKGMENTSQIIPGLDINCRKEIVGNYNQIMTSGRFDKNAELQKKWEEVCEGIGKAINILVEHGKNALDYQVIVYGFSEEYTVKELKAKEREIINKIKKETSKHVTVKMDFRYFQNKRKEYLETLAKSNVFIMGSWYETFGLVAWEALEMGIPIVVSDNSGVYIYMKEELGYLLKGLCGSFHVGADDPTEEMAKAIAEIIESNKVKESAEELRKQMLKRNRWETLAIDIAKTMGIKNVMSADVFNDKACFEFTYASRKLMLDELKKRVQSKRIDNKLVFFDGISTENILKDTMFFGELLDMLCTEGKEKVEVFFGYPTEKAIAERISQIDKESVNIENLKKKAETIAKLKDFLWTAWERGDYKFEEEEFKLAVGRIHLIPLDKSPSVYINILDDEWYFTVKYEKRSSDNATMKLQLENSIEGLRQKNNLIEYMKFILNVSEDNEENKYMEEQLEKW